MRKLLYLVLPLALLSGCCNRETGLAKSIQIPALPANLAEKAKVLPINTDATMGGQVTDNTSNIRAYNKEGHQKNTLIDLYNCVRESINNKKEPKCL